MGFSCLAMISNSLSGCLRLYFLKHCSVFVELPCCNKELRSHVVYQHTEWEVCVLSLNVLIVDFVLLTWIVSVAVTYWSRPSHKPPHNVTATLTIQGNRMKSTINTLKPHTNLSFDVLICNM